MPPTDFGDLRIEYGDEPLRRTDLPDDPLPLLRSWHDAAAKAGVAEPNAMALATCDGDGQPHCRIVLLKQLDERGLCFFTNFASDKGRQLAANPRAAATFWWPLPRNRQVRVTGSIERTDAATADRYFQDRPRAAQLASAASPQSCVVGSREELERMVADLEGQLGGGTVPRPEHWGGFLLAPATIEFWQGRKARLHDRFRYERAGIGWRIERLAP